MVSSSSSRRRSSTIKSALSSLLHGHSNGSGHHGKDSAYARRHSTNSISANGSDTSVRSKLSSHGTGSAANARVPSRTPNKSSTMPDVQSNSTGHLNDTMRNARYDSTRYSRSFATDDENAIEFDDQNTSLNSDPSGLTPLPESFNKEYLAEYLHNRGFLNPKSVETRENFSIGIATSGDVIFLPTVSSNDDEYLARLNGVGSGESNMELDQGAMDDELTGDDFVIQDGVLQRQQQNQGHSATDNSSSTAVASPSGTQSDVPDSGAYQNRSLEFDASMVSFSVAVILSVKSPIKLTDLKVELSSRVRIYWHAGVPPTKTFFEEFYQAGYVNWNLNDTNYDVFVPTTVSSNTQIVERHNNTPTKIFRNKPISERYYTDKSKLKRQYLDSLLDCEGHLLEAGDYVYLLPVIFSNHIPESTYLPSARISYKLKIGTRAIGSSIKRAGSTGSSLSIGQQNQPISSHSSTSSLSSLRDMDHEGKANSSASPHKGLSGNLLKKVKNHLHLPHNQVKPGEIEESRELYTEYPIKVIRTPPPISISTANKPIYINRVWSDSLSYEISFASKYVSLNSRVPIKIKLAPIAKNICVKRVRVSITEKITFVSKNLEYEYDQVDPVAKDPYNPYYLDFTSKRRKERNLALLEVRTKPKGSRALREEIVENCVNDNLLSFGEIKEPGKADSIPLVEPVSIETRLDFPSYMDLDKRHAKNIPPYGIDVYTAIANPEEQQSTSHHKSSVIGILTGIKNSTDSGSSPSKANSDKNTNNSSSAETESAARRQTVSRFHQTSIKANSHPNVKFHTRLNKCKRGLYLDSLHYTNVHARHKLEVMLRISKPDPENPSKLRHYEVLIDTPVFLVSDQCNTGNMELPTYDMATTVTSTDLTPIPNATNLAPPPTFEEAISVPASPFQSPAASPIGSPVMSPSYDPELLSIQQLNLSRSTSFSGPSVHLENTNTGTGGSSVGGISLLQPGSSHRPSISAEASSGRYSNLDRLMFASSQTSPPPPLPMDIMQGRRASDAAAVSSSYTNPEQSPRIPIIVETNPFFKKDYTLTPRSNEPEADDNSTTPGQLPSKDPPTYEEAVS